MCPAQRESSQAHALIPGFLVDRDQRLWESRQNVLISSQLVNFLNMLWLGPFGSVSPYDATTNLNRDSIGEEAKRLAQQSVDNSAPGESSRVLLSPKGKLTSEFPCAGRVVLSFRVEEPRGARDEKALQELRGARVEDSKARRAEEFHEKVRRAL